MYFSFLTYEKHYPYLIMTEQVIFALMNTPLFKLFFIGVHFGSFLDRLCSFLNSFIHLAFYFSTILLSMNRLNARYTTCLGGNKATKTAQKL